MGEKKVVSLYLPEKLVEELKELAIENKTSISSFVREALENYIKQRKTVDMSEKIFRRFLKTYEIELFEKGEILDGRNKEREILKKIISEFSTNLISQEFITALNEARRSIGEKEVKQILLITDDTSTGVGRAFTEEESEILFSVFNELGIEEEKQLSLLKMILEDKELYIKAKDLLILYKYGKTNIEEIMKVLTDKLLSH